MAQQTDPRVFVVGGNGRRSGLAATRVGSVELRILVLPKLWKDRINAKGKSDATDNKAMAVSDEPIPFSRSITIIAREGQKFAVKIDTNKDDPIRTAIDSGFTQLVDTGTRIAKDRADENARLEDEEEDDDAAYTRRLPLINKLSSSTRPKSIPTITLRPAKAPANDGEPDAFIDIVPKENQPAAIHRVTKADFAANWNAFQALWLHAFDVRDMPTATFKQLGQMSASDVASLDLRLLVHIAFVNKVSELFRHARPGYMRVTKPSTFIRGRMNPVSAAVVLAGGATTVECTYDEFGLDTPLHRVIVTALEEVCDSHQADRWLSLAEGPIGDAAWLRRQLESVQTLPRTAALRIGVGLQARMSKLDGDWAGALDLACLVLDDRSLSPAPGGRSSALSWGKDDDKAFVFDIPTESMWEHLVRKYFQWQKPEGRHSWKDLGKTKAPDGASDGTKIIFDAKYKTLPKTPSPGDTHQAFVYSHLFQSNWVLLIYPTGDPSNKTAGKDLKKHQRNDGEPPLRSKCHLASISLAFPMADDVLNPAKWRAFMAERREYVSNLKSAMAPKP